MSGWCKDGLSVGETLPGGDGDGQCPKGHPLREHVTPNNSFGCDACLGKVPQATRMYGCRPGTFGDCLDETLPCCETEKAELVLSASKDICRHIFVKLGIYWKCIINVMMQSCTTSSRSNSNKMKNLEIPRIDECARGYRKESFFFEKTPAVDAATMTSVWRATRRASLMVPLSPGTGESMSLCPPPLPV